MSHLTGDQLSALLDGALEGRAREEAERHLETCAACREALAGLSAQESDLRAALEHDPGEAYFDEFAARVSGRLRAAGLSGAQARPAEGRALSDWFRSPRKLAWVTSTAAVVVVAGIVMITGREWKMPLLSSREIEKPAPQGESARPPVAQPEAAAPAPAARKSAPAPGEAPARGDQAKGEAPSAARLQQAPGPSAPTSRAYEVRRSPSGEDVPVHRPGEFVYRPPRAAAPPPAAPGQPVRVTKQRYATPMGATNEAQASRGGARPATQEEGATAQVAAPEPSPAAPATAGKAATAADQARTYAYQQEAEQKLDSARKLAEQVPRATPAFGNVRAFNRDAADPFAGQSTYTRTTARNAQRLTALAERMGVPSAWDSAAGEWDRVLLDTAGGPLENETRYQVARARYMAWHGGATEIRTKRATEALEAFLARVTSGARHDQARRWLAEVKP